MGLAKLAPNFVFCIVVNVTWNGTNITGPVLIYHDEIIVDPGPTYSIGDITVPGALVCTSETTFRASWRRANHDFFGDVSTVDPRISEGNGTEPPLDMQNLRICKNMNIIKT